MMNKDMQKIILFISLMVLRIFFGMANSFIMVKSLALERFLFHATDGIFYVTLITFCLLINFKSFKSFFLFYFILLLFSNIAIFLYWMIAQPKNEFFHYYLLEYYSLIFFILVTIIFPVYYFKELFKKRNKTKYIKCNN
jgi:hypothetical protein